MELTMSRELRSGYLASRCRGFLYLNAVFPGAIYNRKTFPRKRLFVSGYPVSTLGGAGRLGGFVPAAFVGLKPPLSLRQLGGRPVFSGAAITSQGYERLSSRRSLRRYVRWTALTRGV